MLSTPVILILAGSIIFLGFYFRVIFEEKNLPDVIGLIFLGLLLGPIFHLIDAKSFGQMGAVFSNVVLLWILYNSGINLKINDVRKSFRETVGITTMGFIVTTIVISTFCNYVFGLTILESAFVGSTLGGTNTAVITGLVRKVNVLQKTKTILVMESAMTDIFTLAFPVSIMNYLVAQAEKPNGIVMSFVASLVFSLIIGIGGAFVWSIILNKVPIIKKTKFSSLAFLFIIFGLSEMWEFNGPLTALSFGITIGNLKTLVPQGIKKYIPDEKIVLRASEKEFYDQIEFLLRIFFFVYVGISIRISEISILKWGFVMVLAVFVARMFVVKFVIDKKIPLLDKSVVSVMIAKGLGAAVMATLPIQAGYVSGELMQSICYAMILFSTFLCVILFSIVSKDNKLVLFKLVFGGNN